jgi:hypothetical protein
MNEVISLRKKYINSSLINKKCNKCGNTYPRTDEFFYRTKHRTRENAFNYEACCIACVNKRSLEWKKKNKLRKNESKIKYLSSERGYFMEMWNSVKKSTRGCEFKNFDEFFNCWREQQKIYGNKCPYTGIEMTRIKGINKNPGLKKSDSNISKDRILCSRPYSKENIMFVCWAVNNTKGSVTPKIAKQYIQFVKERFGTDEIE